MRKTTHAPLISVITCTLNCEGHLKKALDSVQEQTYKNIEHIIIDSFSTDKTLEIIYNYIERNKNKYKIKVIQSQPKGVANALNVATNEAAGDIVHYLHSDDYYLGNESLERAASYFIDNPDFVWLTGNFLVEIKGKKFSIPHSHLLKIKPETAITLMNFIHHENTFVKREAVLNYGGFCEDKTTNVEYRLWLRMIQDNKPLVVDDQFTVFIIHKGSTSTGSILKFSQALGRAFRTQKKEKILPLIGYYEDNNSFYIFQKIKKRITEITYKYIFGNISDI